MKTSTTACFTLMVGLE